MANSEQIQPEGEKVAVVCPACSTSYSVPAEQLGGLDAPSFHCSRCDHVFASDSIASAAPEPPETSFAEEIEEPAPIIENPAPQNADLYQTQEVPIVPIVPIEDPGVSAHEPAPEESSPESFMMPDHVADLIEAAVAQVQDEEVPTTHDLPLDPTPEHLLPDDSYPDETLSSSRPVSDPASYEPTSWEETAPGNLPGSPQSEPTGKLDDTLVVEEGRFSDHSSQSMPNSLLETEPVQTDFSFEDQLESVTDTAPFGSLDDTVEMPTEPFAEAPDTKKKRGKRKSWKQKDPLADQQEIPGTRPTFFDSSEDSATAAEVFTDLPGFGAGETSEMPPRRAITYIAAPILLFLVALAAFSYALRSHDGLAHAFASFYGDLPQVAPPGLSLQDTTFQPIDLSDGRRAYVISGKLVNRTEEELSQILLEGLAFDSAGELLTSLRVPASIKLDLRKLPLLSSQFVRELQTQNTSGSALKPGESRPFVIALLSAEAGDARFYSARIFSVN